MTSDDRYAFASDLYEFDKGCDQTCNKSNCLSIVPGNFNLETIAKILWNVRSLGPKDKDELSIILIKEICRYVYYAKENLPRVEKICKRKALRGLPESQFILS